MMPPMDQVSYSADISSIHLDDASQVSDGFKQTGMQSAVVKVEKRKGKKLNRFNRLKRKLPSGEKRKHENLFYSEQTGLNVVNYVGTRKSLTGKSKSTESKDKTARTRMSI